MHRGVIIIPDSIGEWLVDLGAELEALLCCEGRVEIRRDVTVGNRLGSNEVEQLDIAAVRLPRINL